MFHSVKKFHGALYLQLNLLTVCRRHSSKSIKCEHDNDPVLFEKDENITLIGLNREIIRNSIDAYTADKLCTALRNFENDNLSSVAVLYGIGGSFCAGHDVSDMQKNLADNGANYLFNPEGTIGPTRRLLKKPVVCAINGFCVGAGIELSLLCDLRVMEDSAVMGFFNRYLGVPITNGGTVRLAASVGYSRAFDIIATGRRIGAQEALKIGLINRVVATGTALGQAVNLAYSIDKFPQTSLLHDRNSIYSNNFNKKGFNASIQTEQVQVTDTLLTEMAEGCVRFKKAEKGHGSKTHIWNIREKPIPEWEKSERSYERAHQRISRKDRN